MANKKNLIPQAHVLTVEEASKGGKKSAEKRAERKAFREALLLLLQAPVMKDGKETGKDHQDVIVAGLVKRAASTGDPATVKLILDIIGETPGGSNAYDENLAKARELLGGVPDALDG